VKSFYYYCACEYYITEGIYIEPFYRIVYFSGPRLVAILNRYFFAKSDVSIH
jgi:hypothetical protein